MSPAPDRLAEAAERFAGPSGGVSEAVVTGTGAIGGRRAVLIVLDHTFLGPSIGPVAGEKILLAMETAATRRLPLIALCSAGGARTQEGLLGSFRRRRSRPPRRACTARASRSLRAPAHPATGVALDRTRKSRRHHPGLNLAPGSGQAGTVTARRVGRPPRRSSIPGMIDTPSIAGTLPRSWARRLLHLLPIAAAFAHP